LPALHEADQTQRQHDDQEHPQVAVLLGLLGAALHLVGKLAEQSGHHCERRVNLSCVPRLGRFLRARRDQLNLAVDLLEVVVCGRGDARLGDGRQTQAGGLLKVVCGPHASVIQVLLGGFGGDHAGDEPPLDAVLDPHLGDQRLEVVLGPDAILPRMFQAEGGQHRHQEDRQGQRHHQGVGPPALSRPAPQHGTRHRTQRRTVPGVVILVVLTCMIMKPGELNFTVRIIESLRFHKFEPGE